MSTTDATQPLVTLEVYSGRENPSWPLEGGTLEAVRNRVGELQSGGDRAEAPQPVLGYRGFRIEHLGGGAPDAVFVGRGTVTFVSAKDAQHRRDTTDLEAVLLADAATHGHAELLRAAGAPSPRGAD